MYTRIIMFAVGGVVVLGLSLLAWNVIERHRQLSTKVLEYQEVVSGEAGQPVVVGRKSLEFLPGGGKIRISVLEITNGRWEAQGYTDYQIEGSNVIDTNGKVRFVIERENDVISLKQADGDATEPYMFQSPEGQAATGSSRSWL